MLPSQVEPTARAMMGAIKRWLNRLHGTQTSGGTANAHTLTYSVAPTSLVAGDRYTFKAGATNTGATTLNINSLGAIAVQVNGNACAGGEIVSGYYHEVCFDGTNFQLLNPAVVAHYSGGQVGTLSGAQFGAFAKNSTPTGIIPAFRIVTGGLGSDNGLTGSSGGIITVGDDASVTNVTRGALYGLQINVSPQISHANDAGSDVACLVLSNSSPNASPITTETIYVGHNSGYGTSAEFGVILGSDANSTLFLKSTGHHTNVLELAVSGGSPTSGYATISGTVIHTPNNVSIIQSRNAADNADVAVLSIDSSNNVALGAIFGIDQTDKIITMNNGADTILKFFGSPNYNIISLNGDLTLSGHTGITGGGSGDSNLYLDAGGTGDTVVRGAVTERARFLNGGGLKILPTTAPSTPGSGWTLYVDSGDSNKLKAKASTGTVVTLGTP